MELSEWYEVFRLTPFGTDHTDWQFGMLASVTANCHGANTIPQDFIPRNREDDWRILQAKIKGMAAKNG